MNDDDLKRLLRNALDGRQAPAEVKARILSRLGRRRAARLAAPALAAAALLAVVAAWLASPVALPSSVAGAFDQHAQSAVYEHAMAAVTPRQIAEIVKDAIGRKVELPSLNDAGFVAREAHHCGPASGAHVLYANHWLKLSCFVFDADRAALSGGGRLPEAGVDGVVYSRGKTSAVAIREGGVVKLWVSDLRPEQVAAIAIDAEKKRAFLEQAVIHVPGADMAGPVGGILQQMTGVEDVQMGRGRERDEAQVRFDSRRVSPQELVATLRVNEIDATLMGENR